jgi:hypothetical protein
MIMKDILHRVLLGIYWTLMFILQALMFAVSVIPFIIVSWFFLVCPACGKRGTTRIQKLVIQRTTQEGKELRKDVFYLFCLKCGKVRKDIDGTRVDVSMEEWELVKDHRIIECQPFDDLFGNADVFPAKRSRMKSRRKNKGR